MEAMNVHPIKHHEGYQVSHVQRRSCRIKSNVGANSFLSHQRIKSVSRAALISLNIGPWSDFTLLFDQCSPYSQESPACSAFCPLQSLRLVPAIGSLHFLAFPCISRQYLGLGLDTGRKQGRRFLVNMSGTHTCMLDIGDDWPSLRPLHFYTEARKSEARRTA